MMKNESTLDRAVRVILTIVFAYLAYAKLDGAWQVVSYILAVVMILTAITGSCYLYKIFGISTKK